MMMTWLFSLVWLLSFWSIKRIWHFNWFRKLKSGKKKAEKFLLIPLLSKPVLYLLSNFLCIVQSMILLLIDYASFVNGASDYQNRRLFSVIFIVFLWQTFFSAIWITVQTVADWTVVGCKKVLWIIFLVSLSLRTIRKK